MSYEADLQQLANGADTHYGGTLRNAPLWQAALAAEQSAPKVMAALERGESVDAVAIAELRAVWRMRLVESTLAGRASRRAEAWFVISAGAVAGTGLTVVSSVAWAVAGGSLAFSVAGIVMAARNKRAAHSKVRDIGDLLHLAEVARPSVDWCQVEESEFNFRVPQLLRTSFHLPTGPGGTLAKCDRVPTRWPAAPRSPLAKQ